MDEYSSDLASETSSLRRRRAPGARAAPCGPASKNGPNRGTKSPPPSLTRGNIKRIVDKTILLGGSDSGGLCHPRDFRRRADREILASGSTLSAILTSGTWTAPGYRPYIDTQLDVALNITRIALEQVNSDSSAAGKPLMLRILERDSVGYRRNPQINQRKTQQNVIIRESTRHSPN